MGRRIFRSANISSRIITQDLMVPSGSLKAD
jgi:hypothetical protein